VDVVRSDVLRLVVATVADFVTNPSVLGQLSLALARRMLTAPL
jgi:hypothetical protein